MATGPVSSVGARPGPELAYLSFPVQHRGRLGKRRARGERPRQQIGAEAALKVDAGVGVALEHRVRLVEGVERPADQLPRGRAHDARATEGRRRTGLGRRREGRA